MYKAIWTPVSRQELLTQDLAYIQAPASIYEMLRPDPASIRASASIWAWLLFGPMWYIMFAL